METKIKEEPDLKQKRHDEKVENHDVVNEEDSIQKIKMILCSIVSLAKDRDLLDTILRSLVSFIIGTTSSEDLDRNLTTELGAKLKPTIVDFLKHCGPVLRNEMIRSSRAAKTPLLEHVNAQLLDEEQPSCKTTDVFLDLKRRRDKLYDDEYGPPASRPLLVPMHPLASSSNASFVQRSPGNEEQWRNIDVMLNCILSMVEKTIAAIGILQGRSTEDLIAQTIRMTEDRVAQVKKRAEEAVAEVNRKALAELQRAVTAAESRANQLAVPTDRRQDKTNSCWNCGRKAMETCSGCNLARYCGSFCQHKDWESHHTSCRREKFK